MQKTEARLPAPLFLFRVGCVIVVVLLTVVWIGSFDNIDSSNSADPNIARIQHAAKEDSLDILFIGSSATYSGINPVQLKDSTGIKSYNLGIAAAGPQFYELLTADYLSSVKQKPATIWVLVLPNTFMNNVDRFEKAGIHRYLHVPIDNFTLVKRYGSWQYLPQLLVHSFQKGVANLVSKRSIHNNSKERFDQYEGFYPSTEISSDQKEAAEKKSNSKWFREDFQQERADRLYQWLTSLREKGIRIVLYSLPCNRLTDFFNAGYLAAYNKTVLKLKQEFQFIDLSAMKLPQQAYRNADHLNTTGSKLVTNAIVQIIRNDSSIRPRYAGIIPQ
jgi:hypothetical protein